MQTTQNEKKDTSERLVCYGEMRLRLKLLPMLLLLMMVMMMMMLSVMIERWHNLACRLFRRLTAETSGGELHAVVGDFYFLREKERESEKN